MSTTQSVPTTPKVCLPLLEVCASHLKTTEFGFFFQNNSLLFSMECKLFKTNFIVSRNKMYVPYGSTKHCVPNSHYPFYIISTQIWELKVSNFDITDVQLKLSWKISTAKHLTPGMFLDKVKWNHSLTLYFDFFCTAKSMSNYQFLIPNKIIDISMQFWRWYQHFMLCWIQRLILLSLISIQFINNLLYSCWILNL